MTGLLLGCRRIITGITSGVALVTVPSLMILNGIPLINWQEAVLWLIEFLGCVMFCVYVPLIKTKLNSILVAYGFVFLYSALAILCWKINLGTIAWHGIKSSGPFLCFIGFAMLFLSLRYSIEQSAVSPNSRLLALLGTSVLLTGINMTYFVWTPLLAIPGAIVLANIFLTESRSQEHL